MPKEGERVSQLTESELEALIQESIRQQQCELLESIMGQQKGLKALEEAQQLLEDQLEDANSEIDRLRRELEKTAIELEEADYLRKEAENARRQLEETLYTLEDQGRLPTLTDLRDHRMQRPSGVLGLDQVTRTPFRKGFLLGLACGAAGLLLLLEALTYQRTGQELFRLLFF